MMLTRFGNQARTRILVVDDEPTITISLAAIFKAEGYEVETALSGEEAVSVAADFSPDLLITDLIMGEMDGVQTATQITAMQPRCKVFFFSGSGSLDELSERAPEGLVYSVARKPIPVPDLLNAVAYLASSAKATVDLNDPLDACIEFSPQSWRIATKATIRARCTGQRFAPQSETCMAASFWMAVPRSLAR